jgi:hypothetical protein
MFAARLREMTRERLEQSPAMVKAKRAVWSAGRRVLPRDNTGIVVELASFCGHPATRPVPVLSFADTDPKREAAERLKALFDRFGSDKSTRHDYHFVYGSILVDAGAVENLLEIGLGSNNPDVVSNMGTQGRPGASLRAFRDFLLNAELYGADIDRGILFQEDRISTFFLDQTDSDSFAQLSRSIPSEFDLIIDDGLHSPHANIATLLFGLKHLKVGGWFVVEDIAPAALPLWQVVATILPDHYESYLVDAKGALLFLVRRPK